MVIDISTEYILEIVKYMANTTIVIKYQYTYGLSIATFAFDLHTF